MKKTIAALVVVTAAAGFTVARADQGDDKGFGGRHGRRGPNQAQLLEKFDANHNGVLDPDEKAAAKAEREAHRAERQAKMLERFDAQPQRHPRSRGEGGGEEASSRAVAGRVAGSAVPSAREVRREPQRHDRPRGARGHEGSA